MTDYRKSAYDFINGILHLNERDLVQRLRDGLTPDCQWDMSHPINGLRGPDEVAEGFFLPLQRALNHVHRRDEIFIGGQNRRAEGGKWIASITHYVGNFCQPFLGIRPSDHLAFLRAGEFYRLEKGRIAQARIILDLPDLMRQAGRMPFAGSYGLETLFPGPATHDGVLPGQGNGAASLDLVERMLGALHVFDPKTMSSPQQTGRDGTWHDNMMWYGPAGIGSNFRWEGFVKDHREAFLHAFPDRKGGNHYCRIGDGDYAAVSGWPSMTMTFQGDYLGIKADGRPLTLRVMDFYRCQQQRIIENWVLLDYTELCAQMGVDLIARSNEMV